MSVDKGKLFYFHLKYKGTTFSPLYSFLRKYNENIEIILKCNTSMSFGAHNYSHPQHTRLIKKRLNVYFHFHSGGIHLIDIFHCT